jgi:mannose-1-phosphate guanylyltransferase
MRMSGTSRRRVDGLYAVVPAGGAGTRLWPLSRAHTPKFLLDLAGTGRSLLQDTFARLSPIVGADRVVVVAGAGHADGVRAQLPDLDPGNLLLEPSPRESTAAIGLAAAVLLRRDPDAVIGSFAADHVITDPGAFEAAVREAAVAAEAGYVVTLGIPPTFAATAYGYIRSGPSLGIVGAPSALAVERFVEKPDQDTAARYLTSGDFRWNAGMFVARADVLLGHLARHQPPLYEGLSRIADAWDGPEREGVLADRWPTLTRIAIDYAIAEPVAVEGGFAVIPADIGWDDIGDIVALAGILGGPGEVQILGERSLVLSVDSSGLVAQSGARTVTVLGVHDIAVIDTEDAVLVTTMADAQRVKDLVAAWRERGRLDLV